MLTIADIRKLNPCYDPARYLPLDWQGTVSDILRLEACPARYRIWVAVRLVDAKTAQLFAISCAREALAFVPNPDPRSIAACDVAEKFVHGQVLYESVFHAKAEARLAAYEASDDCAAFSAVWAAQAVSETNDWIAEAVCHAAFAALKYVDREKQVKKLLEMVEAV